MRTIQGNPREERESQWVVSLVHFSVGTSNASRKAKFLPARHKSSEGAAAGAYPLSPFLVNIAITGLERIQRASPFPLSPCRKKAVTGFMAVEWMVNKYGISKPSTPAFSMPLDLLSSSPAYEAKSQILLSNRIFFNETSCLEVGYMLPTSSWFEIFSKKKALQIKLDAPGNFDRPLIISE